MDVNRVDWLIDAPVPCPNCGNEAIAKIAFLKARNSIGCRYCAAAIDLTGPGTRFYLDKIPGVVASLLSGSDETEKKN
jgi:hypothetical protein